jgi:DNA polymerase V
MTIFGLIDCNNFYASCEQVFNPKLKNKALVILSNNDGCIISRSKEAKDLGIPMGEAFFKIKSLLKKLHIPALSSNYALYGDMSQRVMEIIGQSEPNFETYSIDEAFIKICNQKNQHKPEEFAQQLQQKILTQTGIPTTIGLGDSKTLAKLANYLGKKSQAKVFRLSSESSQQHFREIPIEKVWGIGRRKAQKLQGLGIWTIADLLNKPDSWIQKNLTIEGLRTAHELRGIPCIQAEDGQEHRKSIQFSRSFGHKITEFKELSEAISQYTAIATNKLRQKKLLTNFIQIYIRTARHDSSAHHSDSIIIPLPIATNDSFTLIRQANSMLKKIFKSGFRYHKAGVNFFELQEAKSQQISFLAPNIKPEHQKLLKQIDQFNQKTGLDSIRIASTGIKRNWSMKREHKSPSYTTKWQDFPIVRA